jgi:hypothetical protein
MDLVKETIPERDICPFKSVLTTDKYRKQVEVIDNRVKKMSVKRAARLDGPLCFNFFSVADASDRQRSAGSRRAGGRPAEQTRGN